MTEDPKVYARIHGYVYWADPYQKQVHLETLLAIAEENQNVANSQALKGYKHGTR